MHAAKLSSLHTLLSLVRGQFMVVKNFSWGAHESHHFPYTSGLQLFWLGERSGHSINCGQWWCSRGLEHCEDESQNSRP